MERLSLIYASTLFDLALENGAAHEFLEQAEYLRDVMRDKDFLQVLVHPHIHAKEKHGFFEAAFSGKIHEDLLSFLCLASEKNREKYIPAALDALIDMIERHLGRAMAKVVVAADIDDRQIEHMKSMLSEKLNKEVDVSLEVDPDIIGGPYIFVDGYYIDWTVRKRLGDLSSYMKEVYAI